MVLTAMLRNVFGHEWNTLSDNQRIAIAWDANGGDDDTPVEDFADYRRKIGEGNLRTYADVQFARLLKACE